MPRGGYQKPSKPAHSSGVGKNSKRTDGQPIRVPNVTSSKDLQVGDRQMLEAAQRVAPAASATTPSLARSATGTAPNRSQGLPPWLLGMDSQAPTEPMTDGMGMGPGRGPEALTARTPAPDIREQVGEQLSLIFNSKVAKEWLHDFRRQRGEAASASGASAPIPAAASLPAPAGAPPAPPGATPGPAGAPAGPATLSEPF